MARYTPLTGFYMTVKAPPGFRIQDELGRFTSQAQKELYAANRELAMTLQYQVGRRIENAIQTGGRGSVSTGRLVRVTMDPQNRRSDRYNIGVGNPGFLDTSIAKYWRTIEEGSAATWKKRSFTSLPLQGFWGHNLGTFKTGPSGPWVSVNAPFSREPGGMYQPFRRGRNGKPSPLPIFHPGHDIAPQNAYQSVRDSPDFRRSVLNNYSRFMNMVIGRGIRPGGFYDA